MKVLSCRRPLRNQANIAQSRDGVARFLSPVAGEDAERLSTERRGHHAAFLHDES